jgi:hypothetical protein
VRVDTRTLTVLVDATVPQKSRVAGVTGTITTVIVNHWKMKKKMTKRIKMTNLEELQILLVTLVKEAKSYGLPNARISDIENVQKSIRAVEKSRVEKNK